MLKKAFKYSKETTEYLNYILVQKDPLCDTKWLLPEYTTFIEPPNVTDHQIACFDGEKWEIKADYRNLKYYRKIDQHILIVKDIGIIPSDNYTNIEPKSEKQKWDGSKWEYPLDWYKESKLSELKATRDSKEYNPVITEVGSFDFDSRSQERIRNAIAAETEGTRNWTLTDGTIVVITINDLKDVLKKGAERSDTLHNTYLSLKEQVERATTIEEVKTIMWPE